MSDGAYYLRDTCRMCGESSLTKAMALTPTPPGNDFLNEEELGLDETIRLGSYGDPSAIPSYVWDSLLAKSKGRTGYTHQSVNQRYDLCMKSADSLDEALTAWSNGIRTFRVIDNVNAMVKDKEILCPASEEAGRRTTCDSCKLCSGSDIVAKSIAIVAHGNGAKYI